jgi:hypothetical protein
MLFLIAITELSLARSTRTVVVVVRINVTSPEDFGGGTSSTRIVRELTPRACNDTNISINKE